MTSLAFILYSLLIAFFILYSLRTLLFNRHPRPLPPGPKPWPVIGNLPHLGTMPHHSIAAMARTYGPLMHLRLGLVDVVVAASASVAAQFLKTHDANFSSRPPNSGAKHIAYNYQDLVFAPYGPRWRMLRKICSVHLFSTKALDDFRHVRQDLFTAGTDTSSSTVEWAIAELIRHPKMLAQAKQELDSVVGPNRQVTESDLAQLTFLQAIIKETFRLHPSTPLSLPRMASDSCEINGYFIPKGSTLLVNVWAIARDPDAWAEPLEFQPERFLPGGEKPNADVRGNDFEVIPFGAGRRICAGMSLGLRMVQLLTATLVHAFDWDLADGQSAEKLNMDEAYGLTLQRAAPLMVHPRPRLAPHVYRA
ncbi:Flavonoid 3'-monooxygenase [Camellia lanceoleosa]|nr:Flavonoid 3'-monooxygenase [Camellia lanceoleosa]